MRGLVTRRRIVPLIVASALFMQNLDSTVIATALPAIARSLGEDPLRLNLAITSYLLSLAVFIPVSGWMADRFGARRVFCGAVLVFTLGSVWCGLAGSLPMLVLARIVQGMGGAMMVPVGRLVMLRSVPKPDLVRAMSWLAVPALVGPVLGPPLGGFIVTYADWPWIFFINVPVGLFGLVLAALFIEDVRGDVIERLDLAGFALAGLGLALLMFGFETAGRGVSGWSTVALVALGAVFTAGYVLHARSCASPILDLGLLRLHTFRAAIAGGSIFRVGMAALPFLLPLMLQLGFGLSAFHSGLLTFASAAGALAMKTLASPVIHRWGFRRVLVVNAVVSALFIAACAFFTPATPPLAIFALLLIGGFFRSLQFTAVNTLGYADVPPQLMSRATGFASMAQQLAATAGVALGALLLHVILLLHGGTVLRYQEFAPAFVVVALFSLASLPLFLSLSPAAGDELTGRAASSAADD